MARLPKPENLPVKKNAVETQESEAEKYVAKYSEGFDEPVPLNTPRTSKEIGGSVVFITGTTGSFGSHLVEQFSLRLDVDRVVCLNRRSNKPVEERQREAFSSRGINLSAVAQAKLWTTGIANPSLLASVFLTRLSIYTQSTSVPWRYGWGKSQGHELPSGWNPVEHLSFLIKSYQSLKALPALEGVLQWVPAKDIDRMLVDLNLFSSVSHPIYHIDNPIGQSSSRRSRCSPREHRSVSKWVKRVRRSPLSIEIDNPAARLIDFIDDNFLRMSCGGLILDTTKAREHSKTLATQGPVTTEVASKYIQALEEMGVCNYKERFGSRS
ncbi:hypothetical protein F4781DRAFT_439960 [Annulohypoxylon bovei var. microspora]|nr:hypothetical protein F4781DRAFT_439960 [Annulohypoxylon bovei var. microspora]